MNRTLSGRGPGWPVSSWRGSGWPVSGWRGLGWRVSAGLAPLCAALLLLWAPCVLQAQSPAEKRWQNFILGNPRASALPEEDRLGLLAGRHSPDALWAGALETCEVVLDALERGVVEEARLLPGVRVLLVADFNAALKGGALRAERLYGLPRRQGGRVDVPVRLGSGGKAVYGNIYLVLNEGRWYVEQWALDLSGFTAASPPEGAAEAESTAGG